MASDGRPEVGWTPPASSKLFDSALYSDLKIRGQDKAYHAHKAIVCPQSAVFASACNPEYGFKEAQENTIDLTSEAPDVLEALLQFFYNGSYDAPDRTQILAFHARMYAAGEDYQSVALKDLAKREFREFMFRRQSCGPISRGELFRAIRVIYETTPESDRALRDTVVEVTRVGFRQLMVNKLFEHIVLKVGNFARDLVKALHEQTVGSEKTIEARCSFCAAVNSITFTVVEKYDKEHTCSKCENLSPMREWLAGWI